MKEISLLPNLASAIFGSDSIVAKVIAIFVTAALLIAAILQVHDLFIGLVGMIENIL